MVVTFPCALWYPPRPQDPGNENAALWYLRGLQGECQNHLGNVHLHTAQVVLSNEAAPLWTDFGSPGHSPGSMLHLAPIICTDLLKARFQAPGSSSPSKPPTWASLR